MWITTKLITIFENNYRFSRIFVQISRKFSYNEIFNLGAVLDFLFHYATIQLEERGEAVVIDLLLVS